MAVVAKMIDGTVQFHPQGQADNALAHYLSDLVNQAKSKGLAKSAGAAELLKSQAEAWDERARAGALSPEVRSYLEAKARDAREQAARLG